MEMSRPVTLESKNAAEGGIAVLRFCIQLARALGLSLRPGFPQWNKSGHIENGKTQWLRFSTGNVAMREYYFETAQLVDYAKNQDRAVTLVNERMEHLLADLKVAQPF